MCLSFSFLMSSSWTQLSAVFSMLLVAITHFTQTLFQLNKLTPRVTFAGQFRALSGNVLLAQNLIGEGVAIIISWYALVDNAPMRTRQ